MMNNIGGYVKQQTGLSAKRPSVFVGKRSETHGRQATKPVIGCLSNKTRACESFVNGLRSGGQQFAVYAQEFVLRKVCAVLFEAAVISERFQDSTERGLKNFLNP